MNYEATIQSLQKKVDKVLCDIDEEVTIWERIAQEEHYEGNRIKEAIAEAKVKQYKELENVLSNFLSELEELNEVE